MASRSVRTRAFPLRLVVPGMEGIYQVKWLRRIKVVDQPYLTFQETSRFLHDDPKTQLDSYEFGPKSVITYPSGTQRLTGRGSYVITGLAWSGGGAVRTVEVSTDGGKTYKEAKIAGPALPRAFTRFYLPWTWDGERSHPAVALRGRERTASAVRRGVREVLGLHATAAVPRLQHDARPLQLDSGVEGQPRRQTSPTGSRRSTVAINDITTSTEAIA